MNLYAIKDRLIEYYMTPFAANNDKDVMAAISAAVSNEGNLDAIAQSPQHFEIWQLAEIDEEGHVTPKRQFLAECSSLIRRSVRKDSPELTRAHQNDETDRGQPDPPRTAGTD